MKEYIIITNLYSPLGGLYKYADKPEKAPFKSTFSKDQQEEFILKWKYVLKEDMYFDPPKTYYVDYETVSISDITDRLEELENSI